MVAEGTHDMAEAAAQPHAAGEGQRGLFKLAHALGCPPVPISPPDEDGFPAVCRRLVEDGSRKSKQFASSGSWAPVEETPEERSRRVEEGLAAVAEHEAEFGPFSPEAEAWAEAVLDRLGIGVSS